VAERLLQEHGLDTTELRVVVELSTGEAILSAVEGGLGIAVVSRYVAEKALQVSSVAEIFAEGLPAARSLYAVMPKATPTRAAEAFLEQLRTGRKT
jgi:DNA-binding transcriptional LysR family regulator